MKGHKLVWVAGYADASFAASGRHPGGGYGIRLRSDTLRIVRSGPTPTEVKNSVEAEAAAVFAAIWTACTTWPQADGMTIKTDCLAVVDAFERRDSGDPLVAGWIRRSVALCEKQRTELRVVWVKGHQRHSQETPAWLNARVDELAAVGRKQQRHVREVARVSPKE